VVDIKWNGPKLLDVFTKGPSRSFVLFYRCLCILINQGFVINIKLVMSENNYLRVRWSFVLLNTYQQTLWEMNDEHIGVRDGGAGGAPQKRLQSRKVWQMFNISRAKSGKLKSQKAPSLLGKQRQSGNICFTVGQYWLIIKITGTNYVNFVVN
jgi:hypothetical protein